MTSRTVGQVWVYTLRTGIYEIILLTSLSKENIFRGILLYSTYKEAEMIGLIVTADHINRLIPENGWKPYVFES